MNREPMPFIWKFTIGAALVALVLFGVLAMIAP